MRRRHAQALFGFFVVLAFAGCSSDEAAVRPRPDATAFIAKYQDLVRTSYAVPPKFDPPIAKVEEDDADIHVPFVAVDPATGRAINGNFKCRFERGQIVEAVPEKG